MCWLLWCGFFFFQAEDGIRDVAVTGVQTCALPIWLIMIGGDESFGLGGYYRTPIEEALPVTMEVKQKLEVPSLGVVLSIDRSGSMAMSTDEKVTKLDLAKEAAHLLVDLLTERNEVGVMSWATKFLWHSPL